MHSKIKFPGSVSFNLIGLYIVEEIVGKLNIPGLPPFFNRLSRSIWWNRVNSVVHPFNSMSLIQSH
jgi:hypothetical protein